MRRSSPPPPVRRCVWRVALLAACAACSAQPPLLRLTTPERPAEASAWRAVVGDVEAELAAARAAHGGPSLSVVARGEGLVAATLAPGGELEERWRVRADVSSGPLLTAAPEAASPGLVLYGERGAIVALDAADGARRWSLPAPGATLLAAATSGGRTALLTSDRLGQRSLTLCDAGGRERLHIVADGALGTPALVGDVLLAPFGEGSVAALDAGARLERARTRLGSQLLHALRTREGLFFGGPPWLTLAGSAVYALPRRPLPGLVLAATAPAPPRPEAAVTRLYVRPSAPGAAALDDLYMATSGRIALGLEREHGSLLWVVALAGRALAAARVPGGLLVCDDSGALRLLGAQRGDDAERWQLVRRARTSFGEARLSGCAIEPGPLQVPLEGAPSEGASRAPPLLDQLARVLALTDPELGDAQRFLSRELAARPEPEATRVLIELVTRRSLDRVLQSEAEDLLAIRRNGQEHMLAALESAARGGDATALPPIAPLGEALAALGERRAAPLLARELNRPAHSAAALARAAAALELLASEAEYDELSVFFALHRTTADSPELVSAVVSVGKTLLRVAGPRARALVTLATRDPLTLPDVRAALEQALRGAPSAPEPRRPSAG